MTILKSSVWQIHKLWTQIQACQVFWCEVNW